MVESNHCEGNLKGRPHKYNVPYTGDKKRQAAIFQEYLCCIADFFDEPYDDCDKRSETAPSLRDVCGEFHISVPKARKLLITAGMYRTVQSRRVAELASQGKSMEEISRLTGLRRSSVSSYLPYKRFSYNMEEVSRHAEDSRKYRERKTAREKLHKRIISGMNAADFLWQAVIAYQGYPLHTSSGLSFSYTVRRRKDNGYSGELDVSRKAGSKTLTKSSVMLAFHKVLDKMEIRNCPVSRVDDEEAVTTVLIPPGYKGPKAIGQIFGISYLYSLFWKLGLISVPEKVEDKLKGKRQKKNG